MKSGNKKTGKGKRERAVLRRELTKTPRLKTSGIEENLKCRPTTTSTASENHHRDPRRSVGNKFTSSVFWNERTSDILKAKVLQVLPVKDPKNYLIKSLPYVQSR